MHIEEPFSHCGGTALQYMPAKESLEAHPSHPYRRPEKQMPGITMCFM